MSVQLPTAHHARPSSTPPAQGSAGDAHGGLPDPCSVAPALVHRAAAESVLVTGGVSDGPNSYLITAMLPRDQHLYDSADFGWADPMLAAEAFRQAGYYIQHRFHGVPETHKFVLSELTLRLAGTAAPSRRSWLPIDLRIVCTPTAKATSRRLCLRLDVEFIVDGVVRGHGSLLSQAVDARIYHAIRARAATDASSGPPPPVGHPLAPEAVGRRRGQDVLLAAGADPGSWLLRLDPGNAELLDHSVDHVPGMALLEAFRQAALVASAPVAGHRPALTGLSAQFAKFCEFDTPIRITAAVAPGCPVDRRSVRIAAEQDGDEVATGTMELRLVPDATGREH
ncbi:ScbA/BarX family gamma-butyrolactone biosynthesis protein [Paractinoplanes ferrugineus]|uniref:Lactone biosynthesis protein n=1 Tax=Paractinoplanes ferrugineus TaxID=113564 RepID=A0A919J4Y7_9ACTN|nr:ScbA/BarX family gamma-butyrolactone biosynthesis protein [Actinoplanes ferrugineus]GIE13093.1 lactone biosynthesis protein [Actinoplanes ferrugineus]